MPKPGITLWRSKNKRGAKYLASWKPPGGKRVVWGTGSTDETEATERAHAEWRRRQGTAAALKVSPEGSPLAPSSSAPLDARTPPASSPPPNGANGARKPISDVLARALYGAGSPVASPDAPAAPPPSSPAPTTTTALVPAPDPELEEKKRKAKKLYQVFAKCMGYLTEGGLKRACRWAGREPEDMDDDEIELVREGWEEKGQDWFGRVDIGPWGKIALGSVVSGVGMYMGGKPLPPPKPKELPPAERKPEAPRTAPEGGASA